MPDTSSLFIQLHPEDHVVVATQPLSLGSKIKGVSITDPIPAGHKVALSDLAPDTPIRKYGQIIGYTKTAIKQGQHVHVHNLEFRQSRAKHEVGSGILPITADGHPRTFEGYRRPNGEVGTRNFIAILTTVNCSATAARQIAERFSGAALTDFTNVDGVNAFVHGTGCAMDPSGEGYQNLQRVLFGYASHPNCGGVLLVGLGCETYQIDGLMEAYGLSETDHFRVMNIQDMGGLRKTIDNGTGIIHEMLPGVNQAQRSSCPVSELKLGLQCGGSDAWSGVTANPALGYASDLVIRHGGTSVLAETPEVYGAEHLLTRRARDTAVAEKLMERLGWWESYTAKFDGSMDNNPSHGNKRGGLTTILEKSLGAVAKSGSLPLEDVYRYGQKIDKKGFVMMDSPGYDPASITGQIASGCNVVAFTTGRGSVYGSKPAPSIKIATNTPMYQRMSEDMDINAGLVLDGEASIEQTGELIFEKLIQVASGTPSLSEAQGLGDLEFVPWQIGAVM